MWLHGSRLQLPLAPLHKCTRKKEVSPWPLWTLWQAFRPSGNDAVAQVGHRIGWKLCCVVVTCMILLAHNRLIDWPCFTGVPVPSNGSSSLAGRRRLCLTADFRCFSVCCLGMEYHRWFLSFLWLFYSGILCHHALMHLAFDSEAAFRASLNALAVCIYDSWHHLFVLFGFLSAFLILVALADSVLKDSKLKQLSECNVLCNRFICASVLFSSFMSSRVPTLCYLSFVLVVSIDNFLLFFWKTYGRNGLHLALSKLIIFLTLIATYEELSCSHSLPVLLGLYALLGLNYHCKSFCVAILYFLPIFMLFLSLASALDLLLIRLQCNHVS